jgi:type I 3-dehydroquinase
MYPPICLVLTSCEIPDAQKYPPERTWLEIRFDYLSEFDYHAPEKLDAWITSLLSVYDKVILTFHAQSCKEQKNEIRYLCYQHWIELGAPYIDISFHEPFSEELMALCKQEKYQTQVILSHHIFHYSGDLQKVRHILREMKKLSPAIAKIAVLCTDVHQAVDLLTLYKEFPHDLIIAMGLHSFFSRFALPMLGAPYTYAAYSTSTAPGLLPIELLYPIFDWLNKQND